jgi:hypothetical protein
MSNAVYWDVMSCGFCKKRRFEGIYRLHHRDEKNQRARNNISTITAVYTANVIPSSLILLTL